MCELPNYTVIIDTSDVPLGLTQYIAQKDLELVANKKVARETNRPTYCLEYEQPITC